MPTHPEAKSTTKDTATAPEGSQTCPAGLPYFSGGLSLLIILTASPFFS